jgi:hypothetical protein
MSDYEEEDEMEEQRRPSLKQILNGAPVWNMPKDVSDDEEGADDQDEIERLKREAEQVSCAVLNSTFSHYSNLSR